MAVMNSAGFFVNTFMGVVVLAIVGMRVNMHRAIGVPMRMGMCRRDRDGTDAFVAMTVFAVMMVRMDMRGAIGMGMRMFVLVMHMRMTSFVRMAMAVRRTVLMHMPVAAFAVAVIMDGFALDARLAGGASTSGTHVSLLQSAAWLLLSRSSRLRVL